MIFYTCYVPTLWQKQVNISLVMVQGKIPSESTRFHTSHITMFIQNWSRNQSLPPMKLKTLLLSKRCSFLKVLIQFFGCYYSSIFASQFVYFTFPVVVVVLLIYVTSFGARYLTTRSECVKWWCFITLLELLSQVILSLDNVIFAFLIVDSVFILDVVF